MARQWVLLCALAALPGCTLFGRGTASPSAQDSAAVGAPNGQPARTLSGEALGLYLETLRDLVEGDAVTQADAFRAAASAADAAPTTTNQMNLALALATPGHPSSNPVEAQKMLSALLASGDALLPEERVLALVSLKDVEQRLILDAEARRLQNAAEAAAAARNEQSAQRLQAALEENRQLRSALDEARAKLDAITNIERSIRERDNGTNPQ